MSIPVGARVVMMTDMALTLPVTKVVMPSVLSGEQNGRIPDDKLVQTTIPGVKMVEPAARALNALVAALRALGYVLKHVGGYRDLRGQYVLFISRYEPCTYTQWVAASLSGRGKRWPDAARQAVAAYLGVIIPASVYWRKKQNANGSYPATAAVPGESNHGWALAVDLAEEYDDDPAADPIRSQMVQWLVTNAASYGFSAELQSEPWHWRYVAGDAIPEAVLAYERGTSEPDYPRATIKLGSKGPDVVKFQQHYNWWNCEGYAPVAVDGDFGAQTDKAMRAFQRGLNVPDDGVYGPVTEQTYRNVLIQLAAK